MADVSCVVDGCEREVKYPTKRLCQTHYHRLWRGKAIGTAESQVARFENEDCIVEGCGGPRRAGPYCYKHHSRVRRHGSPDVVLAPRVVSGEDHAWWTGDDATYDAMHQRVRKARGRAAERVCECGEPARQWSYDRADPDERQSECGPYSLDVEHYVARCVPCHKRFDLAAIAQSG